MRVKNGGSSSGGRGVVQHNFETIAIIELEPRVWLLASQHHCCQMLQIAHRLPIERLD